MQRATLTFPSAFTSPGAWGKPPLKVCLVLLVVAGYVDAIAATEPSLPDPAHWVGAVLQAHPLVQARREEAKAAQSDLQAARWQYAPTPSVTHDTLRGQSASVMRLSQPVWDGGKIASGIQQATIRAELIQTSLHEVEHELATKSMGYWQTYAVQTARAEVLERGMQALQDLDELMSRRTDSGVSALADLSLARVRLIQTRADLSLAQASRATAMSQWQQLSTRQSLEEVLPAGAIRLPPLQDSVDGLRELARQQHPIVMRTRLQLQLQQAEFDAFKAELWPTLSLRAERQRGQIEGMLAEGNRLYASIQYTLGAGVSVLPRLEAAQARLQVGQREQEGTLKELDERLLQDWQEYASLRMRLPDLQQVQEMAQALTESSKRLFVTGRKSWLDLQNALREQLQAELAWAEAQVQVQALHHRLALHAGVSFWSLAQER